MCFLQIEGLCSPVSGKSVIAIFPTGFSLCVSASYFGSSHISDVFIIIIFVMICDQRSLISLLQKKDFQNAQLKVNIF